MVMKTRSIPVCIILSIVTCGIYALYWFIVLTDDVNRLSGRQRPSGGTAFLLELVTCGIYGIYWAYQMGEALYAAKAQRGYVGSSNGILYLILQLIFPIVGWCLMQDEVNKLIVGDNGGFGGYGGY